jgi:predicted nucleic acid-binding protein
MSLVYVDTGGWLALINGRERLHRAATETYTELLKSGARFATSSDVLDETITRLRYDVGLPAAISFRGAVEKAQARRSLRVMWIDVKVHQAAWALIERHRNVELSFTDATSAVIARELKVKKVLGFDGDFRSLGFELVPHTAG